MSVTEAEKPAVQTVPQPSGVPLIFQAGATLKAMGVTSPTPTRSAFFTKGYHQAIVWELRVESGIICSIMFFDHSKPKYVIVNGEVVIKGESAFIRHDTRPASLDDVVFELIPKGWKLSKEAQHGCVTPS